MADDILIYGIPLVIVLVLFYSVGFRFMFAMIIISIIAIWFFNYFLPEWDISTISSLPKGN